MDASATDETSDDRSAAARRAEVHSESLNAILPPSYSSLVDSEAATQLHLALDGLRAAATAGDLQRGANFHVSALRRFVTLKHELSDDARALSIQLVYRLVTADIDLSFAMRRRWCGLLCKLLRRGKHLRLCLPWRPIFDMILQHASSKLRVAAYHSRSQAQ